MLTIFIEHKIITGLILILFLMAVLLQVITGLYLNKLIQETENMAATDKRVLLDCKRKFTNSFRKNNGIMNSSVFVERYVNHIKIGKITINGCKHLSGQLTLLSIFVAGLGACMGIISGETMGQILPFYIMSLCGLYFYFSVSGAVDIMGKKKILKTNIVDFLENNMIHKLELLQEDLKLLEEKNNTKKKETNKKNVFTHSEERELEDLLREYFA